MSADLPTQVGAYAIGPRLDKGGPVEVFSGSGPGGERVAVKLYPRGESDDVRARRLEVLRAVARLRHPALCRVYESGEHEGRVFAAMELIAGSSLQEVLRHRKLPVATCLTIMRAATQGLGHAVRQGVEVDGVSPHGILVRGDGKVVKVVEPGMPLAIASDPSATVTVHGLEAVRYLAPERMAGDRSASPAAGAVYSLGVIGYELLTGSAPVGRFRLPSSVDGDIPPELDPVILRCLSRRPAERYATLGALDDALSAVAERCRPATLLPAGAGRFADRPLARWAGLGVALAALLAAVLALRGCA